MDVIYELEKKPLHKLPYFEDILGLYHGRVMNELFPENVDNKPIYYLINFFHIIGVGALQLGVFLPFKYLIYHAGYIIIIMLSYLFFNKQCYMTLLANWVGNRGKESHMLHIRWKTARKVLSAVLIILVIRVILRY
jgi:hypothetical protein